MTNDFWNDLHNLLDPHLDAVFEISGVKEYSGEVLFSLKTSKSQKPGPTPLKVVYFALLSKPTEEETVILGGLEYKITCVKDVLFDNWAVKVKII